MAGRPGRRRGDRKGQEASKDLRWAEEDVVVHVGSENGSTAPSLPRGALGPAEWIRNDDRDLSDEEEEERTAFRVGGDDGVPTATSEAQQETAQAVVRRMALQGRVLTLWRDEHVAFCRRMLDVASARTLSLDNSKSWMAYWLLHSLDLLEARPVDMADRVADYIGRLQDRVDGGFAGSPGAKSHVLSTYAAVMALAVVDRLDVVDRGMVRRFLTLQKRPSGAFLVHAGGESDLRSAYCAVAVAKLLGLATPELCANVAEHVAACQNYDGGFGAFPGCESHGGYAYCGMATIALLDRWDVVDLIAASRWVSHRQMQVEGGFQGRCNKLVDVCYSFWQGATAKLVADGLDRQFGGDGVGHGLLFDSGMLEKYILLASQSIDGGFADKPGCPVDAYHTCYALSGLALLENRAGGVDVARTSPLFNLRLERVETAMALNDR